jgi:nitrogen regulatory protein P-II 2
MKLIIAMIKPHQLPSTKKALFDADIKKMTITNVLGCGQQGGFSENYRGVVTEINLVKKVRLEVAVNDEFEEKTLKAIMAGAKTGRIGDGKIFVLDLPKCIRIRTEEQGSAAIG